MKNFRIEFFVGENFIIFASTSLTDYLINFDHFFDSLFISSAKFSIRRLSIIII